MDIDISRVTDKLQSVTLTDHPLDVTSLPSELVCEILQYLNAKDLCRAALCSRQWRCATNQDLLWRPLCQRNGWEHFGTVADFVEETPNELNQQSDGASSQCQHNATFSVDGTAIGDDQAGLEGTCGWKQIYMKARRLENNWENGHYRVSTLKPFGKDVPKVQPYIANLCVEGNYLAGLQLSHDRQIVIWDIKNNTCKQVIPTDPSCSRFVMKRGIIVADGSDQTKARNCKDIWTFHVKTGEVLKVLHGYRYDSWIMTNNSELFFDGETVIKSAYGNNIYVWNVDNSVCRHILKTPSKKGGFASWDFRDKMVAAVYGCKSLGLWDTRSGACVLIMSSEDDNMTSCKLGDSIVVGLSGFVLHIWSTKSGELLRSFSTANDFGRLPKTYCSDYGLRCRFLDGILHVSYIDGFIEIERHNAYNQKGKLLSSLGYWGHCEANLAHGNKCIIGQECDVETDERGFIFRLYKATKNGFQFLYFVGTKKPIFMDDTNILFTERSVYNDPPTNKDDIFTIYHFL